MKSLLLLLLIPFYTTTTIHYRQLKWDDYKGKIPDNETASACTCTNIVIGMDTAYAIFLPEKSWTKTKDAELLRHEQLHFAITQIISKQICTWIKIYNVLQATDRPSIETLLGKWRAMQELYDLETHHGTDSIAQKQWEDKIKL